VEGTLSFPLSIYNNNSIIDIDFSACGYWQQTLPSASTLASALATALASAPASAFASAVTTTTATVTEKEKNISTTKY